MRALNALLNRASSMRADYVNMHPDPPAFPEGQSAHLQRFALSGLMSASLGPSGSRHRCAEVCAFYVAFLFLAPVTILKIFQTVYLIQKFIPVVSVLITLASAADDGDIQIWIVFHFIVFLFLFLAFLFLK